MFSADPRGIKSIIPPGASTMTARMYTFVFWVAYSIILTVCLLFLVIWFSGFLRSTSGGRKIYSDPKPPGLHSSPIPSSGSNRTMQELQAIPRGTHGMYMKQRLWHQV